MSLKAYGTLHQINYNTLIYWRQKLKKKKNPSSGFVSLHKPKALSPKSGTIKIQYDYNIELELPNTYRVDDLVALLKGLSC